MSVNRDALPRAFDLSRLSYYTDFALAPIGAAALLAIALWGGLRWSLVPLLLAGVLLWSFAEYLIHRALFHGPLAWMHDIHHAYPKDYVGVASYGTFSAFGVVWTGLWTVFGGAVASGIIAGVLLGYLGYIAIHARMHHGDRSRFSRYTAFMFRLHAGHHRGGAANFGVTSPLFDLIFGTYRT